MSEEIVRFSRLLRIFELNQNPAFIVELEENDDKTLYISYFSTKKIDQFFESYEKTELKDEFKNLSDYCLMSQCVDASLMFKDSPLTHFEADCSSLVNGLSMFSDSPLKSINTEFPLLEDGRWMFCKTKIKEMTINFPKLKVGICMFRKSSIKKITSQFPLLENGYFMFEDAPLEEINCKFKKIQNIIGVFCGTPSKLKQDYPQYFV